MEVRADLIAGARIEHASARSIDPPTNESTQRSNRAVWKVSRLLALVHRPLG